MYKGTLYVLMYHIIYIYIYTVHIPDGAYVRPIYDMVRYSSSSSEMAIDQSGESTGESTGDGAGDPRHRFQDYLRW